MTHFKPALLLVITLAFCAAPFITPPFAGYDPSVFPVQIDRPAIQPAGWAFSIWGVIYLWLLAHAIFGLARRAEDADWDRPRVPLSLSLAIGAVWLGIAGASPLWGTLTIWPMAIAALIAYLRSDPAKDRWMLSGPLAIYAGWLSAAACVSTGVLMAGHGVLGNQATALVMLAVVLALAVWVQGRKPAMPVYGLTVIWALVGIMAANGAAMPVVTVAAGSVGLIMAGLLLRQNMTR